MVYHCGCGKRTLAVVAAAAVAVEDDRAVLVEDLVNPTATCQEPTMTTVESSSMVDQQPAPAYVCAFVNVCMCTYV